MRLETRKRREWQRPERARRRLHGGKAVCLGAGADEQQLRYSRGARLELGRGVCCQQLGRGVEPELGDEEKAGDS